MHWVTPGDAPHKEVFVARAGMAFFFLFCSKRDDMDAMPMTWDCSQVDPDYGITGYEIRSRVTLTGQRRVTGMPQVRDAHFSGEDFCHV
jgi:hypothetical protein